MKHILCYKRSRVKAFYGILSTMFLVFFITIIDQQKQEYVSDGAPHSTEVPYLDDGEPKIGPIEKVYVTTLVTPMGLFNYVDGINSKITPKK